MRDKINMNIINEYFKDLIFTKVVENREGYAIYGAGVSSGIGGEKMRYVLVFVPIIYANKRQSKINDLMWKNVQTRNLVDSYKLKSQRWDYSKNIPDLLLTIQERTKSYSKYINPDFPFEILLLHNPKKKTNYQYANKINLSSAIEVFETIINYKEFKEYPFSPLENSDFELL